MCRGGGLAGDVFLVETDEADDEPAAHFADKHLCGLQDGLFEEFAAAFAGCVAVADADVVL